MNGLSGVLRRIATTILLASTATSHVLHVLWQIQLGGVILSMVTITYSLVMFMRGDIKNRMERKISNEQELE